MAAPVVKNMPVISRAAGTVTNTFTTVARPAGTLTLKMVSADWLATSGLLFRYHARFSTVSATGPWTDAGALEATSQTYLKDGVTQMEPGGIWQWEGLAGWLNVAVDTDATFTWGLQLTLTDAP